MQQQQQQQQQQRSRGAIRGSSTSCDGAARARVATLPSFKQQVSLWRQWAPSRGTAACSARAADGENERAQHWDGLQRQWQHGHPDDAWELQQQRPGPSQRRNHPAGAQASRHPPDDSGMMDEDMCPFPPHDYPSLCRQMDPQRAGAGAHHPAARWMLTDRPGIDMRALGAKTVASLGQVYVILFGVGQRGGAGTEGIYSLRALGGDGLPRETIIVFETEEDASRYAGLLEASMDHKPVVCTLPAPELLDFCIDAGYNCHLEPQGSLLIPPDFNVGVTDWERAMKLRQGMFSVLDCEPEPSLGASPSSSPYSSASASSAGTRAQASTSSLAKYHPGFLDDEELADIRRKLEALLPLTDCSPADEEEDAARREGHC